MRRHTLKKHGLATAGTRVKVTAQKAKAPARLDNFEIEVEVPLELDEHHQKGVEDAVHHCLIHNTMLNPPRIDVVILNGVPVE